MVSNDPEVTAKQALADAFWINRFIFDGNDDPLKEETPFTKALKILWPARDRNIGAEKAMIRRRLKLARNEINKRMIAAHRDGDFELRARLGKELELLSGVAADQHTIDETLTTYTPLVLLQPDRPRGRTCWRSGRDYYDNATRR